MVKVVILCGGRGTRLGMETKTQPKPMVRIGGQPILWHIMKIYSSWGFNDFVLCLGYLGEVIREYFENIVLTNCDYTINTCTGEKIFHRYDEWNVSLIDTGLDTLTGGRVKRVRKYVEDDDFFMLTYGDGVADVNVPKLIESHQRSQRVCTVTAIHPRSRFGLLKLDENSCVKEMIEKPQLSDHVNGGFMVMNQEVFDYITEGMFVGEAMPRLAEKGELNAYVHEGFWHCMDTPADVSSLNAHWSSEHPPWKLWDNQEN